MAGGPGSDLAVTTVVDFWRTGATLLFEPGDRLEVTEASPDPLTILELVTL